MKFFYLKKFLNNFNFLLRQFLNSNCFEKEFFPCIKCILEKKYRIILQFTIKY